MLASQAKHGCSSHIGMIDVACNQSTEIVRVLTRSAAAAFMQQESDPVHIFENSGTLRICTVSLPGVSLNFFRPAGLKKPGQFRHLTPIKLWRSKTQLLFKRLLQHGDVPVLAKDQWHHDPIISRADLPISSRVSEELPPLPS